MSSMGHRILATYFLLVASCVLSHAEDCSHKVSKLERKLNDTLFVISQLNIHQLLQEYNRTKDLEALTEKLDPILDHNSTAFSQLQFLKNHTWYERWLYPNDSYSEFMTMMAYSSRGLNFGDDKEFTLLHWAARFGKLDILEMLLDQGAFTEVRDLDNRVTPFFVALVFDQMGTARLLAERGADVSSPEVNGYTPLHWAAFKDNLNMARYLVSVGANVTARNNGGHIPSRNPALSSGNKVAQYLENIIENAQSV